MFTYYTSSVCSDRIDIEFEGEIIKNVVFHGGCLGNLLGISKLVKGMKIVDVIQTFENNQCGKRPTSCPDQLAKALKEYLKSER